MKPKAEKTLVSRELLERLLLAGSQCSNCCFNVRQQDSTGKRESRSMSESHEAWDKASLALRRSTNL